MSSVSSKIYAVVRSIGERTEDVCTSLLESEVGEGNYEVVNESPFSKAHKRSLQIGVERGRQWTLIIDADVLLRKGAVKEVYEKAITSPTDTFEVHSLMLDKYFGGPRYGGIKLYRTRLLPEAISLIPEAGEAVRPETTMIKAMSKRGYPWILTDIVTSIHDFEQYYEDIFRKGYTHGVKSDKFLETLLPYWKKMAKSDNDFKVLLAGIDYGKKNQSSKLMLDKDETPRDLTKILNELGIPKKKKLGEKIYTPESVDDFIKDFESPQEFEEISKDMKDNLPPQPKYNVLTKKYYKLLNSFSQS